MKVIWASKPVIWWPVRYTKPKDGGGEDVFEFKAKIEAASRADLIEYHQGRINDDDLVRRFVHEWDGPEDEDGNAVPCTRDTLDHVLDHDADVSRGLARAVLEVSDGGVRKNSRTSPG